MSTATAERVAAPEFTVTWEPWTIGNDGAGERRYFVFRHGIDSDGRNCSEHHWNKRGGAVRYTQQGAEKKAHELNRDAARAAQSAAYFARVEADRQEQQTMAQEVRDVAQCGTVNSEMIARWIIGNFTANDEVTELREERREALEAAKWDREAVAKSEERLETSRKRCNSLAEEARGLLAELGAFGAPMFADPLAYAAGSTPLEKVLDMSRNLIAALEAYEMES